MGPPFLEVCYFMAGEQGTRDIQCYKDTFLTNEPIFTQQRHLSGVVARSRERKKMNETQPLLEVCGEGACLFFKWCLLRPQVGRKGASVLVVVTYLLEIEMVSR